MEIFFSGGELSPVTIEICCSENTRHVYAPRLISQQAMGYIKALWEMIHGFGTDGFYHLVYLCGSF